MQYDTLKHYLIINNAPISKSKSNTPSVKHFEFSAPHSHTQVPHANQHDGSIESKHHDLGEIEINEHHENVLIERTTFQTSIFVKHFLQEVDRIDSFVSMKMDELETQLELSIRMAKQYGKVSYLEDKSVMKKELRKRKKNSELQVLNTFTSLYKKIKDVENFSFLNVLLFIKISKKHDRVCKRCIYPVYPELMDTVIYTKDFGKVRLLDGRIQGFKLKLQEACAEFSCDNDMMEAKGKLVMYKGGVNTVDLWEMGYSAGLVVMLLVWFIWEAVVEPANGQTLWNDPAIYLYSFLGNLVVYQWLWAADVYVWEKTNINYLFLLDITVDNSPTSYAYFIRNAIPTLIYLANLILYYKARRDALYINIPPHFFPVSLALLCTGYYIYKGIQERHVVHYRLYSPSVLFHIVTAPFSRVTFRQTVLADVMTSFIKVFSNCAYAACYLITGSYEDQVASMHSFGTCSSSNYMFGVTAFLALMPLWLRFAQCLRKVYDDSHHDQHFSLKSILVWPHSFNALKYVLSMVVVLFGLGQPKSSLDPNYVLYRALYISLLVVSTLYSYWWDITQDFGFLRILPTWKDVRNILTGKWRSLPNNLFLRPLLIYKQHKYRYYIAMILNLILRAMWTLSLIPQVCVW